VVAIVLLALCWACVAGRVVTEVAHRVPAGVLDRGARRSAQPAAAQVAADYDRAAPVGLLLRAGLVLRSASPRAKA